MEKASCHKGMADRLRSRTIVEQLQKGLFYFVFEVGLSLK